MKQPKKAAREKINDVSLLENILKTVASSIGSPISTKKISDTLISSGRKISPNTVEAYLRALTDSYILYNMTRYDIKGRQFLKTLGKVLFCRQRYQKSHHKPINKGFGTHS